MTAFRLCKMSNIKTVKLIIRYSKKVHKIIFYLVYNYVMEKTITLNSIFHKYSRSSNNLKLVLIIKS